MIQSMTAFARQSAQYPWGSLVWEVRSVNHRYLEPHFKLPDTLRALEPDLREKLRHFLGRGKVECLLRLQQTADVNQDLVLDHGVIKQILSTVEQLNHNAKIFLPINPLELLNWPGVMVDKSLNFDAIHIQALQLFGAALETLRENRRREGEQLKSFIEQRLHSIDDITDAIRRQLPAIMAAQRQRLEQRLGEMQAEFDPQRVEQEMVILLQKADVDEELDRLQAHLKEVRRTLDKSGPCGRRLDFLMQELNREANTLSSKSVVSETTQAAVELKVLIEQMREQVQNIE